MLLLLLLLLLLFYSLSEMTKGREWCLGNLLMIGAKIQSPGILPGAMSRVEKEETWLGARFPRVGGKCQRPVGGWGESCGVGRLSPEQVE